MQKFISSCHVISCEKSSPEIGEKVLLLEMNRGNHQLAVPSAEVPGRLAWAAEKKLRRSPDRHPRACAEGRKDK